MKGNVKLDINDFIEIIQENQNLKNEGDSLRTENLFNNEQLMMLKAELLEVCIYETSIHDEYYHNEDNVGYAFHHRNILNKYYTNEELLKYLLQLHEATKEEQND